MFRKLDIDRSGLIDQNEIERAIIESD